MKRLCRRCDKIGECAKNRRICKRCDAKRVSLWMEKNRDKVNARQAKWRAKYPSKTLAYRLRSEYGFSEKVIVIILSWRGGKCVCGKVLKKLGKAWNDGCIDHNHETGKFRGIICNRCNWVLGITEESIKMLNALKKYLKRGSR